TPLQRAAAKGHVEVVRKLLRHQDCSIQSHTGSINNVHFNKSTALHLAAQAGHPTVAKLLLDHSDSENMSIQSYNRKGRTPLHTAVWHGSTDVLKLFLRRPNIDVNSTTRHGKGLLQLAAERGHLKILRLLLENKDHKDIDVNARDMSNPSKPGLTALQLAQQRSNTEITGLRLQHGA
ncbi:ankyrin repeat-containing domain protein, partial [Pyrenochaeta sp. MPI-SDFR-AT-0127]